MATLLSYTKSDVGSPYIYYKFTATETGRTSTTVTLKVTAYGKLATSISTLGTGKGLKAGISFNGGDTWTTWTLKSTSSTWSGTSVHSVSHTIKVSVGATTAKLSNIKVRVLRSDSTGSAGKFASTSANAMAISVYATPTVPTVSASSIELGGSFTIDLDPQYSKYTHTLNWDIGGLYGTIVTKGTAKSYTFSPDTIDGYTADAFGAKIPGTSSYLYISCVTYDGSTVIGSAKTVKVKLTVPTYELEPTLSIGEANAENPFTGYVQNISKLSIQTSCEAFYGATLYYKAYVSNRQVGESALCTTNVLTEAGSITVKVVVTDSRGVTGEATETITVAAYSPPSIELKLAQNGNDVSLTVAGTISNVEDNEGTLSIVYGPLNGEAVEEPIGGVVTSNFTYGPVNLEIDGTATYSFIAYVADKYKKMPSNEMVTGVICISRFAGGKGVTLFEEATGNGFKVGDGQPAHFTGPVTMDNPLTFAYGGLAANSREQALINLLGYTPSYIQVRTTVTVDTWSTAKQNFYPYSSSATPKTWSSIKGNLTLDTNVVTFGDREGVTTYGIRIGKDIHAVRVHSNVYLSSETDSPTGVCATIYRWRESAETQLTAYSQAFTHIEHNNGSYGTCTSNAIIAVQEGDFIFIGAWKSTASRVINTPYGNGRTNMIVEAIG